MEDTNKTEAQVKSQRGNRKTRVGNVVSDVQNKTIIVEILKRSSHKRYKKVVKSRIHYAAHDENNEAKVGDVVKIAETRPLSRTKHWRLMEIIRRNED